MAKAKRIIFSFDEPSERELTNVTINGGFSSKASAVRESVALFRQIQNLIAQGYTEMFVVNPTTNAKVQVSIASLEVTTRSQ
jgi:hypothetical protein